MTYPRTAQRTRRRSSSGGSASTSALTIRGSTWQWRKIRKRVLIRDSYTCQGCGAPATTVGHIQRRADGGGDALDNLRAECWPCQRLHERDAHGGDTRQRDLVVRGASPFFKRTDDRQVPLSVFSLPDTDWTVITGDLTAPEGSDAG